MHSKDQFAKQMVFVYSWIK